MPRAAVAAATAELLGLVTGTVVIEHCSLLLTNTVATQRFGLLVIDVVVIE